MKIAVASDHGGYLLKETVKKHLEDRGIEVLDLGTHSEESVDYPVYGKLCGETVANGEADLGVVCCGTGIGISIAANKVKGIRCARVVSNDDSYAAKTHNHANAISLAADLEPTKALEIVNTFLHATPSIEDRHVRRVNKIISYENGEYNEV
mgnify:CR=1 FL=1